jgi:hypothetical protein
MYPSKITELKTIAILKTLAVLGLFCVFFSKILVGTNQTVNYIFVSLLGILLFVLSKKIISQKNGILITANYLQVFIVSFAMQPIYWNDIERIKTTNVFYEKKDSYLFEKSFCIHKPASWFV